MKKKLDKKFLIIIGVLLLIGIVLFIIKINNKEINFIVSADNGLKISTDAKNWGINFDKESFLDTKNNYKDGINQITNVFGNVSTGGILRNGKLEIFSKEVLDNKIVATLDKEENCIGNGCNKEYLAFDMFFLLEEPSAIAISDKSYIKSDEKYQNAFRVALVIYGTVNSKQEDLAQSLDYGNNIIIWEPNSDFKEYAGIKHDFEVDKNKDYKNNLIKMTKNIVTASDFKGNKKIADLPSGITKARVYIWLESEDEDLEDNIICEEMDMNLDFTIID